jgi:hypothetical protein
MCSGQDRLGPGTLIRLHQFVAGGVGRFSRHPQQRDAVRVIRGGIEARIVDSPVIHVRNHAVSNCVGTGSIVLGVRLKSPIALLLVIAVQMLGAGMPPGTKDAGSYGQSRDF